MKSRITCSFLPTPIMVCSICLIWILLFAPPCLLNAQAAKTADVPASQKTDAKETQKGTQKSEGDAQSSQETAGTANEGETSIDGIQDKGDGLKSIPEMPMEDSISIFKTFMALTFVLGLIFLSAYLFKRITGVKSTGIRTNKIPIHVVGNMPMGDKKYLTIIEIQGEHFFIGITQNSINMLSKLDLEVPEELPVEGSGKDFESIFKKARELLQQRGKK